MVTELWSIANIIRKNTFDFKELTKLSLSILNRFIEPETRDAVLQQKFWESPHRN